MTRAGDGRCNDDDTQGWGRGWNGSAVNDEGNGEEGAQDDMDEWIGAVTTVDAAQEPLNRIYIGLPRPHLMPM